MTTLTGVHAHGAGAGAGWVVPVVVALALLGAYAALVLRRRSRLRRPWPRRRTLFWVAGVVAAAAAWSPPLAAAGHVDARAHMAQHLLLGMYAPLGLVLGAPVTLLLGATPVKARRRVTRVLRSAPLHVLAHPASAAVLSVGSLFALYLTPLYPLTLRHSTLHSLLNVHFLLAGCLFAWAVAGPDPAPRRPGVAVRAGILVVAAGAHAYLAKVLYAGAATLPLAAVHPAEQIQQAAMLMYYGGDGAEVLLAVALFAGWYRARGRLTARAGGPPGRRPSPTTSGDAEERAVQWGRLGF